MVGNFQSHQPLYFPELFLTEFMRLSLVDKDLAVALHHLETVT